METAKQREIFLEKIYKLTGIQVRIYDSKGKLMTFFGLDQKEDEYTQKNFSLWTQINEIMIGDKQPLLYIDKQSFVYGCFLDEERRLYAIGPSAMETSSKKEDKYFRGQYELEFNSLNSPPTQSYIDSLNLLSLAYFGITDTMSRNWTN